MNRAALIALSALLALPTLADEPAKSEDASAPAATSTAAPAPATATDSPLVAAAKRSNRLGKKPSKVITNESLGSPVGTSHMTTAATQPPITLPPSPSNREAEAAIAKRQEMEKRRKERERIAREKATAERQRQEALARAAAEEGVYDAEGADSDPNMGLAPPDAAPPPQ
jgi:hypothetical protein